MPQDAWSDKRERQYEHIKDSYKDRGVSTDEAEERAARTVNKDRAEHGETKTQRKRSG
jgi:plasmid stabilization system protein ParE